MGNARIQFVLAALASLVAGSLSPIRYPCVGIARESRS